MDIQHTPLYGDVVPDTLTTEELEKLRTWYENPESTGARLLAAIDSLMKELDAMRPVVKAAIGHENSLNDYDTWDCYASGGERLSAAVAEYLKERG